MNFSVANNLLTITIDQSMARRQSQKQTLQALVKDNRIADAIAYAESFNGVKRRINVPRHETTGHDKLADKSKNSVLRAFQELFSTTREWRPETPDQTYIGVEIECMVPIRHFPNVNSCGESECSSCDGRGNHEYTDDNDEPTGDHYDCDDCGGSGNVDDDDAINASAYQEALGELFQAKRVRGLNVKDDGSIDAKDGYFPCEITVLTRIDKPQNLELACKVLNDLGAKVNKSCGLHVHLDARHLRTSAVEAIGERFRMALPVLLAMVPPTRRNNTQYCAPSVSELSGDRYHAVNLTAFKKFKTIEVRLHSSTTDYHKIISWAKLILAISQSETLTKKCREVNELTEYVSIDENLLEYITQRTALFSESETDLCTSSQAQDQDAA